MTAALHHNGARWSETNSTIDMLRGYTEKLQSFNSLQAVLKPHHHCEQWVGCRGASDQAADNMFNTQSLHSMDWCFTQGMTKDIQVSTPAAIFE